MIDLESIYTETLERCTPEQIVRAFVTTDTPRTVIAIGKCAGALLDGVAAVHEIDRAFAAVPHGYRIPKSKCELAVGGHPDYTPASFEAGKLLLHFLAMRDESGGRAASRPYGDDNAVLFLISGGGSACVELPLEPWFTASDLVDVNSRLISSGIPIGEINVVRKHLSAIKGGRLAQRAGGRTVTLVYSDVSRGALQDVASGPTVADASTNHDAAAILVRVGGDGRVVSALRDSQLPETVKRIDGDATVIADNDTLTATAAAIATQHGFAVVRLDDQLESDVAEAALLLVERAAKLERGAILVAGGEPTVVKRGSGRGGRCSELAVRFLLDASDAGLHDVRALFGSSDGLDGNSGVAGVQLDSIPSRPDRGRIEAALANSDSFTIAAEAGRPIMIPPAGNNLRDLVLLARS